MDNTIRNILIVGGGTSGWFSALFFDKLLNTQAEKFCEITLIESKDEGIIGVGEATVNYLPNFFRFLNIDEHDFLVNCDGSFKLAIKFVNWLYGKNEVFWHPFAALVPQYEGFSLFDIWLNKKLKGEKVNDYAYYFLNPNLCDLNKSPKLLTQPPYQSNTPYAYHLNTDLLGKYLGKIAVQRGIKHLQDKVGISDVSFDEKGFISSVKTSEHGELFADLFIDCSGFKGVLINKAYKEPFVYYTDSLLNDSAVAVRLPNEKYANGMPPYTKATAMKYGWIWDIPLFSRRGIGYVYCSKFISKEEAERELMEDYLGMRVGTLEPNHLKMRVGKTRNNWVKNCLSIGLSGGFIEPLESTGIALICVGLWTFLSYFPDKTFSPKLIESYNNFMTQNYESVKNFLITHYCTTEREDTEYWKYAKYSLNIPDSLKNDLEIYYENRISYYHHKLNSVKFFDNNSYLCILAGMSKYPEKLMPITKYKNLTDLEKHIENLQKSYLPESPLISALPGHYEFLSKLNGANSKI